MTDWTKICALEDIPRQGSRVVESAQGRIAVFRTHDDAVFALADRCPHRDGPLSQGIVCGCKVTCPLHNWNIQLDDGHAVAPDVGQAATYPVKVEAGMVFVVMGNE
jgi:nitrite reductase (NADH) small subunit